MTEDDFDYFIRRTNEERQRADESSDPAVAQIHRQLAEHYEEALASLHRIGKPRPDAGQSALRWAGSRK